MKIDEKEKGGEREGGGYAGDRVGYTKIGTRGCRSKRNKISVSQTCHPLSQHSSVNSINTLGPAIETVGTYIMKSSIPILLLSTLTSVGHFLHNKPKLSHPSFCR